MHKENLQKHIENSSHFNVPVVVALNHFASDTDEEIAVVSDACKAAGVPMAVSTHFANGGAGAEDLARCLMEHANPPGTPLTTLYDWSEPVKDKIRAVALKMYGAQDVVFSKRAERTLRLVKRLNAEGFPVCMAKTHLSLSTDPKLKGMVFERFKDVRKYLFLCEKTPIYPLTASHTSTNQTRYSPQLAS